MFLKRAAQDKNPKPSSPHSSHQLNNISLPACRVRLFRLRIFGYHRNNQPGSSLIEIRGIYHCCLAKQATSEMRPLLQHRAKHPYRTVDHQYDTLIGMI